MKLSVIIPVFNEVKTVCHVIDAVRNCGVKDLEIIVVDDCSTDGTSTLLDSLPPSPDLVIAHHDHNQGKGAGIRTAQRLVTGDVVIEDHDKSRRLVAREITSIRHGSPIQPVAATATEINAGKHGSQCSPG